MRRSYREGGGMVDLVKIGPEKGECFEGVGEGRVFFSIGKNKVRKRRGIILDEI